MQGPAAVKTAVRCTQRYGFTPIGSRSSGLALFVVGRIRYDERTAQHSNAPRRNPSESSRAARSHSRSLKSAALRHSQASVPALVATHRMHCSEAVLALPNLQTGAPCLAAILCCLWPQYFDAVPSARGKSRPSRSASRPAHFKYVFPSWLSVTSHLVKAEVPTCARCGGVLYILLHVRNEFEYITYMNICAHKTRSRPRLVHLARWPQALDSSKAMRVKHLLACLLLVSLACCAICASVLLICSAAFAGYLLQPVYSVKPAAAENLPFGGSVLVRSQEQVH